MWMGKQPRPGWDPAWDCDQGPEWQRMPGEQQGQEWGGQGRLLPCKPASQGRAPGQVGGRSPRECVGPLFPVLAVGSPSALCALC